MDSTTRTGCCDSQGGPDFSKMDFKKLQTVFLVSHVNWWDGSLWFSVAAVICLPALCSMMCSVKQYAVPSRTLLEILAFVLNVFKLCKFNQMMEKQPKWEALESSIIIYPGYQLVGTGLILYTICVWRYGFWNTFFHLECSTGESSVQTPRRDMSRVHPQIPAPSPGRRSDLKKMLNTAAFFCHLGYSLICASQAGMMVTMLQAMAHCYG